MSVGVEVPHAAESPLDFAFGAAQLRTPNATVPALSGVSTHIKVYLQLEPTQDGVHGVLPARRLPWMLMTLLESDLLRFPPPVQRGF